MFSGTLINDRYPPCSDFSFFAACDSKRHRELSVMDVAFMSSQIREKIPECEAGSPELSKVHVMGPVFLQSPRGIRVEGALSRQPSLQRQ